MIDGRMKNRIDSLQGIRALAFFGVFASHSRITVFASGGVWGVSVFFILSGFLMVYSYFNTDRVNSSGFLNNMRFGVKTIKKIYPLHIVTMLLAVPFLIIEYKKHPGVEIHPAFKIVANALLVQSWFPSRGIYFSLNAVSWYLSTTLFLYIMFPVILSRIR